MINPWPLLEICLVWLCRASHVKYEYLPTYAKSIYLCPCQRNIAIDLFGLFTTFNHPTCLSYLHYVGEPTADQAHHQYGGGRTEQDYQSGSGGCWSLYLSGRMIFDTVC